MKKDEALETIDYIKQLISDTRKLYFDDGIIHIIWGSGVITGIVMTYFFGKYGLAGYVAGGWIFINLICLGFTIFVVKKVHRPKNQNFAGKLYTSLWKTVGLAIIVFSLSHVVTQSVELKSSLALIALLLGVAYTISAQIGVYRWMYLVAAGWWLGALVLPATNGLLTPLLMGVCTFFCELIPGVYLFSKRNAANHDEE